MMVAMWPVAGGGAGDDGGHVARGEALDEKLNILPITENGYLIYFPVAIFFELYFLP